MVGTHRVSRFGAFFCGGTAETSQNAAVGTTSRVRMRPFGRALARRATQRRCAFGLGQQKAWNKSPDETQCLVNGQPESYQLVRRISTDKRASSDQPIAGGKPTSRYYSGESRFDYFRVADKPGDADKSIIQMFALMLFILAAIAPSDFL